MQITLSGPHTTGLILGLQPTNERRRYKVTSSLIGWAANQESPLYENYVYLCYV